MYEPESDQSADVGVVEMAGIPVRQLQVPYGRPQPVSNDHATRSSDVVRMPQFTPMPVKLRMIVGVVEESVAIETVAIFGPLLKGLNETGT